MKKHLILLLLAISTLLLVSCDKNQGTKEVQGYVETRLFYISSPLSGTLQHLYVHRGELVKANQALFILDQHPQLSNLKQAQANVASAKATLANLKRGQRETVLAAIRAQIAQAKAKVKLTKSQLMRSKKLYRTNALDKNSFQEAEASYKEAQQQLKQYRANLAENSRGSRKQLIIAQEATVHSAVAKEQQAAWYLKQKAIRAPKAAQIFDVYFRQGELVPEASAVLSLFTPQDLHVVFYVPEPKLSEIKLGKIVKISCDGCQRSYSARISYISPQAEYAPPVIYSRSNSHKLVFSIKAKLLKTDNFLHPGAPIYVSLTGNKSV